MGTFTFEAGGKTYEVDAPSFVKAAKAVAQQSGAKPVFKGVSTTQDRLDRIDRIDAKTGQDIEDAKLLDEVGYAAIAPKIVQGFPFIGEYADEAFGLINESAGKRVRDINAAMDRQYPKTSVAGQLGGGLLGAVPAAMAAGPAILGQGTSLAGKAIRGLAAGGLLAGAEGAVSGYGAGEGDDRARSAATRGMAGLVLGGALSGLAPIAGGAIGAGAERLAGAFSKPRVAGVDPVASDMLTGAARYTDPAKAGQELSQAGEKAMLADAAPSFRQLLNSAANTSPAAANVAKDAIEGRLTTAKAELDAAMDAVLGDPVGPIAATRQVADQTGDEIADAYKLAYGTPINYSQGGTLADPTAAQGGRILDLLDSLPAKDVDRAIEIANRELNLDNFRARRSGKPEEARQLLIETGEDGARRFSELPSTRQLDQIKRAFDEMAEAGRDPVTGAMSPQGRFYSIAAREVRNAVSDANPAYREALETAIPAQRQKAMIREGRRVLQGVFTREQLGELLSGSTKPERAALAQGVRAHIDEVLSNARRTLTQPDTDIRAAQQAVSDLSSDAVRQKIGSIVDDADPLFTALDEVGKRFELAASTARNSDTAMRTRFAQDARDGINSTALDAVKRGQPLDGPRRVLQSATGTTPTDDIARMDAINKDIVTYLTQPGPSDALEEVLRALQAQRVNPAIGRIAGNGAVLGVGLPAHLAITQSTTR